MAIGLVVIAMVSLGIMLAVMFNQTRSLSNTLDTRHLERNAQFDALLCIASHPNPNHADIQFCFESNGVVMP